MDDQIQRCSLTTVMQNYQTIDLIGIPRTVHMVACNNFHNNFYNNFHNIETLWNGYDGCHSKGKGKISSHIMIMTGRDRT